MRVKFGKLLFSKREIEILELLSRGYTNKAIANEIGLDEGTIKTYICRLVMDIPYPKDNNVSNRWSLTHWYLEYKNNAKS